MTGLYSFRVTHSKISVHFAYGWLEGPSLSSAPRACFDKVIVLIEMRSGAATCPRATESECPSEARLRGAGGPVWWVRFLASQHG